MAVRLDPEGNELVALTALVPSFAGRRVLEVGCGDGRLTRLYAEGAASVVAIDPDGAAIAIFSDDMPATLRRHVELRAVGFEDVAIPDHSVDVVLLSWFL